MTSLPVVINGGGLVGAFLALCLRKKHGLDVVVMEKRVDLRKAGAEAGRSINLVVTSRGLNALAKFGLEEKTLRICVPVVGRAMHNVDGSTSFQPYGSKPNEVNYSVSRSELNCLLITAAEEAGAKFHFNADLKSIDFDTMTAQYGLPDNRGTMSVAAAVFFGADGVGSATRTAMLTHIETVLGDRTEHLAVQRLGIGYKEVTFPPTPSGEYPLDKTALHIWPRGPHFLMALADRTSSFTGTLYLPDGSAQLNIPEATPAPRFDELGTDRAKNKHYFETTYPDAVPIVPDFVQQLVSRPDSLLGTIRCNRWHLGGKCVLIGDAAHGITPFLGQGMNVALEGAVVLNELILAHGGARSCKWETIFAKFQAYHKPNSDAIADMAIENFAEMSYKVGQAEFLARKALEVGLMKGLPPNMFLSRYVMVTQTLIPYHHAQQCGRIIDLVLDRLIADGHTTADPNALAAAEKLFTAHLVPYLERHKIHLNHPEKEYYGAPVETTTIPSKL